MIAKAKKSRVLGLVAEVSVMKKFGKTFFEYLKWFYQKRNLPYKVRLPGYPEGDLQYQDETGLYNFFVMQGSDKWDLFWPGTKGKFRKHPVFSKNEKKKIISRLKDYLSNYSSFGRKLTVRIIREKK